MPHEKINPWVIALRILFTLALIWAVVFIFSNTMEVAQVSSAHSDEVLALVNPILAKVNLGPLTSHQIRKLAHFAEYTLLGFLAMLCLRVYTRRFVRHISWPLLFGLLFFSLTRRTPSLEDLSVVQQYFDKFLCELAQEA